MRIYFTGMTLSELKSLLSRDPEAGLRFILPGGRPIPADFHVTEVGHSRRHFMDCGGKVRLSEACMLQVWRTADDSDHRLKAGKLAAILKLAGKVVPSDSLDVEVEYEDQVVSQYTVESSVAAPGLLEFTLGARHTDCLAREACGLDDDCCGGSSCN
jgi:hypothetical protein